jgi:hypothetical protein
MKHPALQELHTALIPPNPLLILKTASPGFRFIGIGSARRNLATRLAKARSIFNFANSVLGQTESLVQPPKEVKPVKPVLLGI